MSNYVPLKHIRGIQSPNDVHEFCFSWDASEIDLKACYLWIYIEGQGAAQSRQIIHYSQCYDHYVQVRFPYAPISLTEIKEIRFLVFASILQKEPSAAEMNAMIQIPDFICTVCSGRGELEWNWETFKNRAPGICIESEKVIPEGFVYLEYQFMNHTFQIDIPGMLNAGMNYYDNFLIPGDLSAVQVKSRIANLRITRREKKRGFFGNILGH